MQNNTKELVAYLKKLGVEPEAAEIYLLLVTKGALTALQLSRETKVSRTSMYRLLERMQEIGIVEMRTEETTTKAEAAPLSQIARLVEQKKVDAEDVTKKWPEAERLLSQLALAQQPETKVLFFRGADGVRQMIWNELRAEKEIVGYSYRAIETIAGEKFANEFFTEFVRRNLRIRDLYGDEFVQSVQGKKRPPAHDDPERVLRVESRYIDDKTLTIQAQMDIYNDVVSIYSWYKGEVFGIEIYNPKVAEMQRQLFELAWKVGKKN